jgi:hypothetical protein
VRVERDHLLQWAQLFERADAVELSTNDAPLSSEH